MNIMITAMGMGRGFASPGGSEEGAVFVVLFSALGLLLLAAAGCILRGCESRHENLVRYTEVRH